MKVGPNYEFELPICKVPSVGNYKNNDLKYMYFSKIWHFSYPGIGHLHGADLTQPPLFLRLPSVNICWQAGTVLI